MFLSSEELEHLTGKKRSSSQALALRMMEIKHLIRPDGAVIVLQSHLESKLDDKNPLVLKFRDTPKPNWEAL